MQLACPIRRGVRNLIAACLLFSSAWLPSANAVVWTLDTPIGVGLPPLNVGTVTLTQTGPDTVHFELAPNWTNIGGANAFIRDFIFIFSDSPAAPTITNTNATDVPFTSQFLTGGQQNEESYSPWKIELDFETGQNDNRFEAFESASWDITGTGLTLDDFSAAFAGTTSNPNRPPRAFALIQISGLPGSDSKYLAPVPEPSTYAMLFAGLGMLLIGMARRKL